MKKWVTILVLILCSQVSMAQKLDSLFFNLYTDSLKKGTFNYINVDGRYSNGTYLPLSEKQLKFTASEGEFSGNSLYVDSSSKLEKITIRIQLKADPSIFRETTIYLKKSPDSTILPTMDEVLGKERSGSKKKRKKS